MSSWQKARAELRERMSITKDVSFLATETAKQHCLSTFDKPWWIKTPNIPQDTKSALKKGEGRRFKNLYTGSLRFLYLIKQIFSPPIFD